MTGQILRDVDAQELNACDTFYFSPVIEDRGVNAAFRFPQVPLRSLVIRGLSSLVFRKEHSHG